MAVYLCACLLSHLKIGASVCLAERHKTSTILPRCFRARLRRRGLVLFGFNLEHQSSFFAFERSERPRISNSGFTRNALADTLV